MKKLAFISFVALTLFACKKDKNKPQDDHDHDHEQELITSVIVNYEDSNGNIGSAEFADHDGDGGEAPTVETIQLAVGETYTVTLQFLDESDHDNVKDLTQEILEEADEHKVCYSDENGITVTSTDSDGTYEIGIESTWVIDNSSSASEITITLKHQPNVKDGTCAPGETDVEVTFPINVIVI